MVSTQNRKTLHTSAKIWSELVSKLDSNANEAIQSIIDSIAWAEKLICNSLSEILAFNSMKEYLVTNETILGLDAFTLAKIPVAGVDSSRSKPVRIGHMYYMAVSSAAIIYPGGYGSDPEEYIYAYPVSAPISAEPSYVNAELVLSMFNAEVKALQDVASYAAQYGKVIVFLDGPIVDPPRFSKGNPNLYDQYEEYVEHRAKVIKQILDHDGLVVGVVKRVTGSFYAKHVSRMLVDEKAKTLGDYGLALYTVIALRPVIKQHPGVYTLIFQPAKLTSDMVDAELYERYGIEVYTTLIVPRLSHESRIRPLRVEVAVKKGVDRDHVLMVMKEAAAAITLWLVPQVNIPEPILTAHMRCSIRRKEARILLREIVTRSIYNAALNINDIYSVQAILEAIEACR